FDDLFLLLFDRIEHGPDDWIVVDHQVSISVSRNRFRDYLLHCLGAEADVFALRLDAQRVVWFVLVAQWLQLHDCTESAVEVSFYVLQTFIRENRPRST